MGRWLAVVVTGEGKAKIKAKNKENYLFYGNKATPYVDSKGLSRFKGVQFRAFFAGFWAKNSLFWPKKLPFPRLDRFWCSASRRREAGRNACPIFLRARAGICVERSGGKAQQVSALAGQHPQPFMVAGHLA